MALASDLWRRERQGESFALCKQLVKDPKRTSSVLCDYAQALIEKDKRGEVTLVLE